MDRYVKLNNGVFMPRVGLGTYRLNDPRGQVRKAIELGYRLIDTALDYDNEEQLGLGIKDSGIAREDLFITSKVWFRWSKPGDARKMALDSLKKLGVDYLDMCMIHWPLNDYYTAYRDLEELYREGKIRAIGVCNFTPDRLIDLLSFNEFKPQVNQIETHVRCQRWTEHEWFDRYDVTHQAYSPLGAGRIDDLMEDPLLGELAQKYGKTRAQICLRFLLQRDICILPRTNSEERLKENIDLFDFKLEEQDMEALKTLDRKEAVIGRPEDPAKVKRDIEVYR
ncbi:MAG: aldo/keto reductase [Erysipelotrichaceae bacterium]|nr:aldo/keto reductase [Erysipelotrichaceae bacterium]